jgi:ornithine carbamoyltransferase
MKTNFRGRHFISLKDWNKEELETLIEFGFYLKTKQALGEPHELLKGKTLGMLFADDSLRHRVSFEAGITQLGGHGQFLDPVKLHLVHSKEPWHDTIHVMCRYIDGIMLRLSRVPSTIKDLTNYGAAQALHEEICEYASMPPTIPVISAYSEVEHPCQVLANVMTLVEKFGWDSFRKKKVAMVWGYSKLRFAPSCWNSMAIAAGTLGMNVTFARPDGFHFDREYEKDAMNLAEDSGANLEIVDSMEEAVKDADVIYVEPQSAIGVPLEESERMRSELKHWQVRQELWELSNPNAYFMHDMPIRREEEVTSEVADGPNSIIYDTAENSLHIQKAIMAMTMA